ncbi:tetratricopeptide repeat protein [Empedobacter sedimenti]|uniref:tetratricopeptide repeat protein n=1 Tax=Empedobacter sedimenti TaxID=3042610 RepID=UPI0024A691E6|nr:tetratricopeptide repeat protein [Empedobacter sedimenti]
MTRIEYLVAHPYEVEKSDIPLLKKEVEKYPYFYTLRALLLYGLKKENHPSFEDYLNKTSIHSSNRADLYHYINSDKLPEPESLIEEPQPEIETIEQVNTEEIIANDFSDETVLEDIQTEENLVAIETNSLDSEINIEQIIPQETEKEAVSTEETIEINTNSETDENEDIVDEMIENDTEESELRTDHVVDIISDDELNEVAEITNEVVEASSIEIKEASVLDIENAILQTSSIEIKTKDPIEEKVELISEKIEIVEKSEEKITEQETENVSIDNTFSFSDWLKKVPSQSKDEKTIAEEQETAEREIKYKLIDDFLEKNPKIVPMKKTDITPVSTPSNFVQNTEEYSDLMTETLAQIYIEQKKYDKAIKAYKILILKYPEKNSLFANRIKEIENLKNSK